MKYKSHKSAMATLRGLAGLGAAPSYSDLLKRAKEGKLGKKVSTPVDPTERLTAKQMAAVEKVVSAFVAGKEAEDDDLDIKTLKGELNIGTTTVGSYQDWNDDPDSADFRKSSSKMLVCPGKLEGNAIERAAANILLKTLKTGVQVKKSARGDKDYEVFATADGDYLRTDRKSDLCFLVDVMPSIKNASLKNIRELKNSRQEKKYEEAFKNWYESTPPKDHTKDNWEAEKTAQGLAGMGASKSSRRRRRRK